MTQLDDTLRVHFLGTGTSTALPVGPCLAESDKPSRDVGFFLDDYNAATASDRTPEKWGGYDPTGNWPASVPCGSCRAAVDPRVRDGWKNRRGNPAVVLRKKRSDGEWRNVVVDVGKTFREQSCKLFPRWGVKRIDAVILTHGHADAYNGLDDLREWCGRQGGSIPIYCSKVTFETVAQSYPYLVDKTKASGGGDLPSLKFIVLESEETVFEVEGIKVACLPVHHGSYFAAVEPSKPNELPPAGEIGHHGPRPTPSKEPFICLGFVFDERLIYLSDINAMPERTWDLLKAAVPNFADSVLIMDTLWPWRPHPSHVSFPQAMDITLGIKPKATYLLGMTHPTTHYVWEEVGLSVRDQQRRDPKHADTLLADALIAKIWEHEDMVKIADDLKAWGGRVEPAWDGLGLEIAAGRLEELPLGRGSAGGWAIETMSAAL